MALANSFPLCRLPDGSEVFCLNRREARMLDREVKGYLSRGITLNEDSVVFDVGANIGLFTLLADRVTGGRSRIFAFEPVPEIFAVLKANTKILDQDRIRIFPLGLGNASGRAAFSYFPNATVLSRFGPGISDEAFARLSERAWNQSEEWQPGPKTPLLFRCLKRLPRWIRRRVLSWHLSKLARTRAIECRMETLSGMMAELGIDRIDLLKIDVEGAERDVLAGIGPDDRRKIDQAVIEVHSIDQDLESICAWLRESGLTEIEIHRPKSSHTMETCLLYARRTSR